MGDEIRVETDGLTKFSDRVPGDVARTIESGYTDARVALDSGVRFGENNASGGVHAAKERYAQSLAASSMNIIEYMAAARVLADAAAKVAAAFDASDTRSAAQTSEVNAALQTALSESRMRRATADGHPATRRAGDPL